jgi:hypothetical protein
MPAVSGLLVKAYKESLRKVHTKGSLEQRVEQHASALSHASVDPHRALGRFRQILVDGDLRAAWSASKQRAKARLQLAYAYASSSVGIASTGGGPAGRSSDVAEAPAEFREMLESHPALRVGRLWGCPDPSAATEHHRLTGAPPARAHPSLHPRSAGLAAVPHCQRQPRVHDKGQ